MRAESRLTCAFLVALWRTNKAMPASFAQLMQAFSRVPFKTTAQLRKMHVVKPINRVYMRLITLTLPPYLVVSLMNNHNFINRGFCLQRKKERSFDLELCFLSILVTRLVKSF